MPTPGTLLPSPTPAPTPTLLHRVTAVAFAGAAVPDAAGAGGAADAPQPPLLASAGADRSLRLWHLGTMQRLRALYKRPAEVTALATSRWVLPRRVSACRAAQRLQPC